MKKLLVTLLLITGLICPVVVSGQGKSESPPTSRSPSLTLNDYQFTAPEGWFTQRRDQFIVLSQTQGAETGYYLQLIVPQLFSGNLEQDTRGVFDQMYPGWQYRFTGSRHDDLTKGITSQGLPYCQMEAGMSKTSADGSRYEGFEDGSALVIQAGNQLVIIAGRHNRLLDCECFRKYDKWPRFFNSFRVRNVATVSSSENVAQKLIGAWVQAGGNTLTEYVFAANGNFQVISAYGTTTQTTDHRYEYIHTKTSAFQGDGSYTVTGHQINLKRRGDTQAEQVSFRLEKVNHGSTGWKDRLCMLKNGAGGQYEVCYEKREH